MGFLDDLKNQAADRKASEDQLKQRQAELEKIYQETIHPKMVNIYKFLTEMCEHLNYLKPDTRAFYPLRPDGSLQSFKQGDYKVTIDSANCIKNVTLRFFCELDAPLTYDIEHQDRILRYSEVLESYRMPFTRKDYKDDNYELISANFKVTGPLPVHVIFQGDVENSAIKLLLTNFERPGTVKHTLQERHIEAAFFDSFGKYLLRENDKFMSLDISEQDKEKIRQQLQQEMLRRQQELEEAERLQQEEQLQQKQKSSWRNIFSKDKS